MNMREIARLTGLSSATISRVINGSALVKEETKRRVQKVLDEVNFIPNPSATTLKYGRSSTVGLVIPDIRNPFFAEFLAEFEDVLADNGHELLLTTTESSKEKLVRSVRRMLMRQVDGAVLLPSEIETRLVEPLFGQKVPVLTIDRDVSRPGCGNIQTDYLTGSRAAVKHLRELGHTRIGYVGGSTGMETTQLRLNAFLSAMRGEGLSIAEDLLVTGDFRVGGGEAGAARLMRAPKPPTAIMTANDLTAYGVLRCMRSMALRVPQDVSVIGLDDVLLDGIVDPPLTTIRLPRRTMAVLCFEGLLKTKEDLSKPGPSLSLPTELIVRESTACPRSLGK